MPQTHTSRPHVGGESSKPIMERSQRVCHAENLIGTGPVDTAASYPLISPSYFVLSTYLPSGVRTPIHASRTC